MTKLIEPWVARAVARRLAGSPSEPSYLLDRLHRDLADAVPRSEELVAQASGIPAPPPVTWRVIDRVAWAETNIETMATLIAPLVDKVGPRLDRLPVPVRLGQRTLVSAELGVLLGYVSRRVLGQYDMLVTEQRGRSRRRAAVSLYFVGPNIVETERTLGFVPEEFALWVSLHEVTHRFQFDGVPWLRERFFGLVRAYLDSLEIEAGSLAKRFRAAASRVMQKSTPAEEKNPVYLLATDEQRAVLDDIQALMAVVEGHGNFVMDSVGEQVIPSLRRMRHVFDRRRRQTGLIQRAVNQAIGLELKLRQYELGQTFCRAVTRWGGEGALAYLWADPSNFPTLAELREPESWMRRVA